MATKWLVDRWEQFFFALNELESVAEIEALCKAEIETWRSRPGMKKESSLRIPMTDTRNEIKVRVTDQRKQELALRFLSFDEDWYRRENAPSREKLEERLEHQQLLRDPDAIVAKATELLSSNQWPDLATGLALCTGRRPGEVLKTAVFEKKTEYSVLFSGQLKRRGKEAAAYEIPTLCEARLVIAALERLRAMLDTSDDVRSVTQRYSPLVQETANKHFNRLIPARETKDGLYGHLFRSIYPRIAVFWYCPPYIADIHYMAEIQGHSQVGESEDELRNYASGAHYFDYKIADKDGNIDGRQGVKLGMRGVELLEVFKPKPRKEKAMATTTEETAGQQKKAEGKNVPVTVDRPTFNRVQALKAGKGHRTYGETVSMLLDVFEQGGSAQGDDLQPENLVSPELAASIREAMTISKEENFMAFLADALSKEAKFRTSLSKRHEGKDFSKMTTSQLTNTKHPEAAKERIRRAVAAIAIYNNEHVPAERWFLNARTVQMVAGARYPIVEEWMKEHEAEVDELNKMHELNARYNSKPYTVKSVVTIPEEAE